MKITILTLFPEMFQGPLDVSIIKRAKERGHIEIELRNIRDFGIGRHKIVDDTPYGGSTGMIMRVDVLYEALAAVKQNIPKEQERIVLLSAKGLPYTQRSALGYSTLSHLILICGHYEGVDERITNYIDEEISVGDFITTGGEIPAMLIADSVTRLVPGVLKKEATAHESFTLTSAQGLLVEYPHYTSPRVFMGQKVPEILLSGDHKKIAAWREGESESTTQKIRPDLLKKNQP